jgi:hypothetical protein
MRLHSFPQWEFDDIHHEAFVFGVKLAPNYNPKTGTMNQYLSQRLYDYVSRSYYKKNDIVVQRKRDKKTRKMGPREYRALLVYLPTEKLPDMGYTDPELHDFPDLSCLSDSVYETALHLAKGKNQRECSDVTGVSESAVAKRVIVLRDLFDRHTE